MDGNPVPVGDRWKVRFKPNSSRLTLYDGHDTTTIDLTDEQARDILLWFTTRDSPSVYPTEDFK